MSRFAILILCLSAIATAASTLDSGGDARPGGPVGQGAVLVSAFAP